MTSIGADGVIDYTREDSTKAGGRYDVILDNVGNHSLSAVRRALAVGGTLVYNSGASMGRIAMAQLLWRLGQNVRMFNTRRKPDDLAAIGGLIESGKLRSIIDRTYSLAPAGAAIAYVEAGHARGKVVVTVG